MRADGAAHLEIPAGSARAAASGARVASVPESEADPESLASLGMLRRCSRGTQQQQRRNDRSAARDVMHCFPPRWVERSPIFEMGAPGASEVVELIATHGYVECNATVVALRRPAPRRDRDLRVRGIAAGGQAHAPVVQP